MTPKKSVSLAPRHHTSSLTPRTHLLPRLGVAAFIRSHFWVICLLVLAAASTALRAQTGTVTTTHTFTGPDGDTPIFGLVRASDGNLYGVTTNGGPADQGVLYRVGPDG